MGHLHRLKVFVAVAEAESFSGAARKLGMTPPAVTRAIAALEERLDVKLLNRTTRSVRLTDTGQVYLEGARRILNEVAEADETVQGVQSEPRGRLCVTAPVQFGKLFVTPAIIDYLQRYPQMAVSGLFLDRVVNLQEEGLDVGIRIGDLPDSTMKAIRVGQVRKVVCASPAYLADHPEPRSPAYLTQHLIVAATSVTPIMDWTFRKGTKKTLVRVQPRFLVNSIDAALDAVLNGSGLTRLLSYQVAHAVQTGQLVTLLKEYEPPPLPIHVLHLEGRYASAKVRTFVDLVVATLRANRCLQ